MGKKYVDRELAVLAEKWKEGQQEIDDRKKKTKVPPDDEDQIECDCWWDGSYWVIPSFMTDVVKTKKSIYQALIPSTPEKIPGNKLYLAERKALARKASRK